MKKTLLMGLTALILWLGTATEADAGQKYSPARERARMYNTIRKERADYANKIRKERADHVNDVRRAERRRIYGVKTATATSTQKENPKTSKHLIASESKPYNSERTPNSERASSPRTLKASNPYAAGNPRAISYMPVPPRKPGPGINPKGDWCGTPPRRGYTPKEPTGPRMQY